MSKPSPLERVSGDRLRPIGEGTGWTLLRYGWPALLIFAGAAWGMVVQPISEIDPAPYGLTREALEHGRWDVVVNHVFVTPDFMSALLLGFPLFAAGVTAPALQNPDWMGGWRFLAVFLSAAAVGAVVHLLTGLPTPLQGAWPALLAVAAWVILARRMPKVHPAGTEAAAPSRGETAANDGLNIGMLLLFLIIELRDDGHPFVWRLGLPIWSGFAIAAGGALLAYLISRFGGRIGQRILLPVLGSLLLALAVLVVTRLAPRFDALVGKALTLPWAAWIGAITVGVAAGLLERKANRAD